MFVITNKTYMKTETSMDIISSYTVCKVGPFLRHRHITETHNWQCCGSLIAGIELSTLTMPASAIHTVSVFSQSIVTWRQKRHYSMCSNNCFSDHPRPCCWSWVQTELQLDTPLPISFEPYNILNYIVSVMSCCRREIWSNTWIRVVA